MEAELKPPPGLKGLLLAERGPPEGLEKVPLPQGPLWAELSRLVGVMEVWRYLKAQVWGGCVAGPKARARLAPGGWR